MPSGVRRGRPPPSRAPGRPSGGERSEKRAERDAEADRQGERDVGGIRRVGDDGSFSGRRWFRTKCKPSGDTDLAGIRLTPQRQLDMIVVAVRLPLPAGDTAACWRV